MGLGNEKGIDITRENLLSMIHADLAGSPFE